MPFTTAEANLHTLLDKIRANATEDDTITTMRRTADADAAKRYEVAVYRGGVRAGVGPSFRTWGSTITIAINAMITAIKNDFTAKKTVGTTDVAFTTAREGDLTTLQT